MAVARGSTVERGYGYEHRQTRAELQPIVLAGGVRCARCGEEIHPWEPWDLGHVDGDRSSYAGPEHRRCNRGTSGRRPWKPAVPELKPERDGLHASDERWRVPWLEPLLEIPPDAVWPRLMTVPHPRAVGSLGAGFADWVERREGPLRWWQRLVATRLLEHDDDERLVWEALILSMARQLGKSWLLRELLLWRIHQGERIGEPQDAMHTGKDVAVCKEVQRRARFWAKARPDLYKVREVNGQEEIEFKADGSRWMLRAKEAVYGYSASTAAVDEAWKVAAASIEEGLVPTMVERSQPQLWLVSTAHRKATSLMLTRRQTALAELETGDGDLLIEWSAPRRAELDDVSAWRLASPHWTPQRERLIGKRLEAAKAGELETDPDEPDPVEAFRAQWLNQWPQRKTELALDVEDLLPSGLWEELADRVTSLGPVWVALEDDFGHGAAVAAAAMTEDGRIEVDGWLCDDWDSAIADALRLGLFRPLRQFLVGASLLSRVPPEASPAPQPVGVRETRVGLPLLRDLAMAGQLVHDETPDLDDAVRQAQVKETLTGLQLVARGPIHLVRALVWAVNAAHKPAPEPAIY